MKIFISILLIIEILNPKLIFQIKEGWKFKDAEPSDEYLIFSRLGGIICLIATWIFL